jgi:Ca2+:H+ antiporter
MQFAFLPALASWKRGVLSGRPGRLLRKEAFLALSAGTSLAFIWWREALFSDLSNPAYLVLVFVWLLSAMLGSSVSVVRHADQIALRLGEPYGTLVLTLSVTFIEVTSITTVMLHGANNPTLVRETIFAVVMIVLNGMVGFSLLLGGLRHGEQHYNLQGANTYLGVIIPLVVLPLVLPDFTQTTPGPTLSAAQQIVFALVGVGLYCCFLVIQTGHYHGYFAIDESGKRSHDRCVPGSLATPLLFLLAYLGLVVFLAEELARPIDFLIETLAAPTALGGIIVATLVATPEAISAIHAARENHMQRSVNIFLGSVLSTIGLTVPVMLLICRMVDHTMYLGVEHGELLMLLLTLAVSVVTFASGRTNVMQGAVHLVLFATYVLLIIQG